MTTDSKTSSTGERHDWTVAGMNYAACANKISTAFEGLLGVADMLNALRLLRFDPESQGCRSGLSLP